MYIKKITGKKCYLAAMRIEDAEQYTAWLNDLEITNYLTLASSVITVESEKELLKDLSRQQNYSIIDIETDTLIGSTGLAKIDTINQSAEIGIFIGDKSFWNKGYGQEALSLLIDYAYKRLNLHNIYLSVYSFNKRAVACYEKIGFKKIGEKREAVVRNLEYYNIIYMDILPKEFYVNNQQYKINKEDFC